MSITRKALSYLQFKFKKNIYRNSVFNFRNDANKRELHSYSDSDVSSVTVSDMRRILRLHGFATEDGFTCLLTKCPICKNLSNFVKNPGQAYINKTTGFFLCPTCDYSGQWNALEKVIKKPKELANQNIEDIFKITSRGFENKWEELVKNTDTFSKLEDYQIQEILKQFNLPIFPDVSKVLGDVRLSTDQQYLYFPLQDLANRNVGYVICQSDTSFYTTKPDENCGGLLWFKGSRSHSKDNPVIIVPTIGDALALVAQRISGSVVCLPYGLKNLPQQALPALEKSSKLILWAGSDSIEHVRALARKLGETRCLVIRAAGLQSTAQEAFRNNLDLKTIIASAHSVWHKSVTTFKSLREDVLADLKNIEKVQGIKWRRYPTLNKLLHGHRRGELTVLTGPTGCGKTTFCSEYSLDLAQQGVNTLWGSFEIRNARLVRTMLQQLAGFPLEKNLDQFDKYADMFQQLPLYFLMFHGQQTIKDVMEAVEHASYVHDIAHVIIDNVQFMLGVGDVQTKSSDRFWRQDAVIASFRTFATRTNCHVTLVMHPRKERDADDLSTNSIFGSAKASQEADNVLIIQDKRLTTLRGKKYLQIAKNRYSGDLGIMPLEFDKNGLSYSQKKKTIQKENVPISE